MPVLVRSETNGDKPININRLKKTAQTILALCKHQNSEVSILLVSDQAMQELNGRFRNKQKPTNVLSFPMQEGHPSNGCLLGDVAISIDTANREALHLGVPLRYRVSRLLVHGIVHLQGFDHERSGQEAMESTDWEEKLYTKLIQSERNNNMTKLAINVDHVATLRQARGINEPDPVLAAGICELAGASGIVVHLREDRRHIQDRDVQLLRQTIKTKLNLEMGAEEEIINIALDLQPDLITLVPEKREELTTEGGLDVAGQIKKLTDVVAKMTKKNIPVSMFIDPDASQIQASVDAGASYVEIHTGRYCDAETEDIMNQEFDLVASAADRAFSQGLKVNAGHGLNYLTTSRVAALDSIEELSIGHAIMARAIFVGLDQAVREMLAQVHTEG